VHELSICSAIAGTVTEHAGGRPVRRVRLRIGHYRQVVPETLSYCWRIRTRGTDLDRCELEVDYVPAAVSCRRCGDRTALDAPALRCGACQSPDVELVSGDELLIESIDVG
jgi:hydrogenase nickel incorporation protein HypA/HybF